MHRREERDRSEDREKDVARRWRGSSKTPPQVLVCHSPGVLRHVTYNGAPLVSGRHVTGLTNGEEEEMQLTKVVPFLVEDELLRLGATFEKLADWQPFFVADGRLITGPNPASSTITAQGLMKFLGERAAHTSA